MTVSTDKPTEHRTEPANWQGYFIRSIGSFPANVAIAVLQTMMEMMIDTARMGVEIVKVPWRAKEGETELAIRPVVEASMESVWNLLRNLFRPIKRSHLIGKEVSYMMDIGMAFRTTLRQIRQRWGLFWDELWDVSPIAVDRGESHLRT